MNNINISVLVPVYGVEKYIERCARSLFEQTLTDGVEFIFCNDCTPDNSISILMNIISEYPNIKDRIRIVEHPSNKGLQIARETLVKSSAGDFFIFVDSDDWIELNMLEVLYDKAISSNADFVGCNYYIEKNGKSRHVELNVKQYGQEALKAILDNSLKSFLCMRLIRRDYYDRCNIKYYSKITCLEDMLIAIPLHVNATKIEKVEVALYHYDNNTAGMSQLKSLKALESSILALNIIKDEYVTNNQGLLNIFMWRWAKTINPLITYPELYDPKRWRELSKSVSLRKHYDSIKTMISPMLVKIHADRLNHAFIKFYRQLVR